MKRVILASRSPRRRELLAHIVPEDRIEVLPPQDSDEAGFEGLGTWPEIEARLLEIARDKCDDVCRQLAASGTEYDVVIAADTVIVGEPDDGPLVVLGQPPADENWRETVAGWFHDYLLGREHTAATGLCVATSEGKRWERIVKTGVTMAADRRDWVDWYLQTGEPQGKAGGYAIQGAGGLFVTSVNGSLSNVIGLPLEALREILLEVEA